MECPVCHTINPDDQKYCIECGSQLTLPDDFLDILVQTNQEDISSLEQKLSQEETPPPKPLLETKKFAHSQEIKRLIAEIFAIGFKEEATDIHLEPLRKEMRIRFRIEGQLREILPPISYDQSLSVIYRLKLMGQMDPNNTENPQTSDLFYQWRESEHKFRVTTTPTIYGEKMVLRLFAPDIYQMDLDSLGFNEQQLKLVKQTISRPFGLVLVVGPGGSGKTTTLYALISHLNSAEYNIITIEDPISWHLEGVNQMTVMVEKGFTFDRIYKTTLRQDPDVIMIGEIEDVETANLAVNTSLTGHVVISQLPLSKPIETIHYLRNLPIHDDVLAESLLLIIAQRQVKRICSKCERISDESAEYWLQKVKETIRIPESFKSMTFMRGGGCDLCQHTGYYGRIAIFEVFAIDPIRELIRHGNDLNEINKIAAKSGLQTMIESGIDKVVEGKTTLEEFVKQVLLR